MILTGGPAGRGFIALGPPDSPHAHVVTVTRALCVPGPGSLHPTGLDAAAGQPEIPKWKPRVSPQGQGRKAAPLGTGPIAGRHAVNSLPWVN